MGFQSLEFRVSDFRLSGVQGFRGSGFAVWDKFSFAGFRL